MGFVALGLNYSYVHFPYNIGNIGYAKGIRGTHRLFKNNNFSHFFKVVMPLLRLSGSHLDHVLVRIQFVFTYSKDQTLLFEFYKNVGTQLVWLDFDSATDSRCAI